MKTETGSLDWNGTKEVARKMSDSQLVGALADIRETLPVADANDREEGTDTGGVYRDEASVYHAELKRRGTTFEAAEAAELEAEAAEERWAEDCSEAGRLLPRAAELRAKIDCLEEELEEARLELGRLCNVPGC